MWLSHASALPDHRNWRQFSHKIGRQLGPSSGLSPVWAGREHLIIQPVLLPIEDVVLKLATSVIGPSRHFAATRRFGRFAGEADINGRAGPAGPVANDPKRTSTVFRTRQLD